jgi:hypothetical protein
MSATGWIVGAYFSVEAFAVNGKRTLLPPAQPGSNKSTIVIRQKLLMNDRHP